VRYDEAKLNKIFDTAKTGILLKHCGYQFVYRAVKRTETAHSVFECCVWGLKCPVVSFPCAALAD
jgi:hypothetical protein